MISREEKVPHVNAEFRLWLYTRLYPRHGEIDVSIKARASRYVIVAYHWITRVNFENSRETPERSDEVEFNQRELG